VRYPIRYDDQPLALVEVAGTDMSCSNYKQVFDILSHVIGSLHRRVTHIDWIVVVSLVCNQQRLKMLEVYRL